jgi:hypothetical protein
MQPVVPGDADPSHKERDKKAFHGWVFTEFADPAALDAIDFPMDLFNDACGLCLSPTQVQFDFESSSVPSPPPSHTHQHFIPAPIAAGGALQSRRTHRKLPKVFSYTKRSSGRRQISNVSDPDFVNFCRDRNAVLNPLWLGFIPASAWDDCEVTFGTLVTDFFQRKNNASCRFVHKLYNALRITTEDPFYFQYVGVQWISDSVMKVDKHIFAQLLGIKSIEGALFHLQGNFPSHGFVELSRSQALESLSQEAFAAIESDHVRLLKHAAGTFVKDATEAAIRRVTWARV